MPAAAFFATGRSDTRHRQSPRGSGSAVPSPSADSALPLTVRASNLIPSPSAAPHHPVHPCIPSPPSPPALLALPATLALHTLPALTALPSLPASPIASSGPGRPTPFVVSRARVRRRPVEPALSLSKETTQPSAPQPPLAILPHLAYRPVSNRPLPLVIHQSPAAIPYSPHSTPPVARRPGLAIPASSACTASSAYRACVDCIAITAARPLPISLLCPLPLYVPEALDSPG